MRKEIQDRCASTKIVIHIFANIQGLVKVCIANQIVASKAQFESFLQGFNSTNTFIDFFDVGFEKDAADRKLLGKSTVHRTVHGLLADNFQEYYDLHKFQPQCEYIMLGCCHDRGYVRPLRLDKGEPFIRQRLTLLYATSMERDFRDLGLPSEDFTSIFRNKKLAMTPVFTDQQHQNVQMVSPPTSWAIAAVSGSSMQTAIDEEPKLVIALNSQAQRVDEPLASHDGADFWKRVSRGDKFCKGYYLGQACPKPQCKFIHESLSNDDLLALRNDARGFPCYVGADCRSQWCYYGHQCYMPPSCGNDDCKLAQFHGNDGMIHTRVESQA